MVWLIDLVGKNYAWLPKWEKIVLVFSLGLVGKNDA
jgi:hypothetical protein